MEALELGKKQSIEIYKQKLGMNNPIPIEVVKSYNIYF
jgi:hypothetical protein